ncbi:BZ3500_MvSof-1268-A1-R1_Chr1-3g02024 [Microbotryum saponariae]|uniref:BZ3500_MvSof-1268-A1-R1_Chr1-3g02024 protein n=1 Tax=Microbotryum saponariae TaxID=289078 RepID=A0A2X0KN47_9BASI|nr:BZ3500_MvSof-1268-A1-R1_Chr1-3g02024 [Microbotryum saponariae]SCZ95179.1 BZ3501_MvSof-1269-A2-R1_Chr1-3g01626 [Microbotryum saponariae]
MSSDLSPLAQATGGAIGAAISNSLVYPLDVLVTRLQTAKRGKCEQPRLLRRKVISGLIRSIYLSCVRRGGPHTAGSAQQYTLLSALKSIVRREGWTSLYAGLASDSISTALSNFLYYFSHAFLHAKAEAYKLKSAVPSSSSKKSKAPILSAFEEIFVGCLAGVVAKAITSPLSIITVRQQTSTNKGASSQAPLKDSKSGMKPSNGADSDSSSSSDSGYGSSPSMISVAQDIIAEKGILGLWSGFQNSIVLTTNPAITTYLFELIRRMLRMGDHPMLLQTFLAGAFASSGASAITYPLILAKVSGPHLFSRRTFPLNVEADIMVLREQTRLQFKSPSGRRLYKSNFDVFSKTIKRYGLFGMYQGLEGQIAKAFLSEGVKLVVKERIELVIVLVARYLMKQRRAKALAN